VNIIHGTTNFPFLNALRTFIENAIPNIEENIQIRDRTESNFPLSKLLENDWAAAGTASSMRNIKVIKSMQLIFIINPRTVNYF
jgi:hypothetical protein